MAEVGNPLTHEDLATINDGLAKLDEAEAVIRRAKQAGIDMTEQQKQASETRQKLLNIKRSFFPGQ